ncbi:MAG TPA: NADP-dependent oxidoreductase [Phototrophicaceae bacterium]|nr:NADP-dependent oxidoreductase [Phototrophicaceae bacterium]
MKAVRIDQWGIAAAAVVDGIDRPQPGSGEVLVHVKATSVNPLDWKICEGYLQEWVHLPVILGSDIAGIVEAVGDGVMGFSVGTPVYGMQGMRGGAYAEYAIIPASELGNKPTSLSYAEAAAVPHTGLTAWQGLFDFGELKAGQRVLIHAAAGGVGHFAVQFAKLKGAYVIGTASANNEAFVRGLGADEVVDYKTTPFESVIKDVDLVLDTVGFDTTERSLEVLKPGGILVSMVTPPPAEAAASRNIQAKYMGAQPTTALLNEIAQLIDSGKVKPVISQTFTLDQVQEALRHSQSQHVRGKLALTVGE